MDYNFICACGRKLCEASLTSWKSEAVKATASDFFIYKAPKLR